VVLSYGHFADLSGLAHIARWWLCHSIFWSNIWDWPIWWIIKTQTSTATHSTTCWRSIGLNSAQTASRAHSRTWKLRHRARPRNLWLPRNMMIRPWYHAGFCLARASEILYSKRQPGCANQVRGRAIGWRVAKWPKPLENQGNWAEHSAKFDGASQNTMITWWHNCVICSVTLSGRSADKQHASREETARRVLQIFNILRKKRGFNFIIDGIG
jgi:hypothetical protein